MKRLFILVCFLAFSFAMNSQQKTITVGDSVPNFKLWFVDGTTLTQNDIKNKVVVLKFWFTSCLPCVSDISTLNKLVNELKNRNDILFIAPALDRKDVIKKFLYNHKFDFKIAYSAIEASLIFNAKQIYPSYYVIDKNGRFVYVDNQSKKSHFSPLKEAILTSLKE
ncbi:TlpA family protein disulfide reductase [Tenacibaculum sp. UWU-22]|uniref:TlpA family protein disulfide reductase n=1 Tax=Tenacibaculum sp. UWU-22 TaxID=3234187 RepID=UPI0034DB607F